MLLLCSAGTWPKEKGLHRFPVRLENRLAVCLGGMAARGCLFWARFSSTSCFQLARTTEGTACPGSWVLTLPHGGLSGCHSALPVPIPFLPSWCWGHPFLPGTQLAPRVDAVARRCTPSCSLTSRYHLHTILIRKSTHARGEEKKERKKKEGGKKPTLGSSMLKGQRQRQHTWTWLPSPPALFPVER